MRVIRGPILLWLAAFLLTVARAETCVADFDMTGNWNVGAGSVAFEVFHIVQNGTALSVAITHDASFITGTGTIDPMTGAFSIDIPSSPPNACGGQLTGQLGMDGNTFIAPGTAFVTPSDCQSISCTCSGSEPIELRGSRAPCNDGVVDPGEECDDAHLGAEGACCELNCTAKPAGGTCFTDHNPCTDSVCGTGGVCTHPALPDGTDCNDGDFCDGEETGCHAGACSAGPAPCPLACDESADQCVTTCPTVPQSCRTAEKSLLSFNVRSDATHNKLLWKWLKGTATSQPDFSDPTAGTEYALCFYAGPTSSLATQRVIPAGGAWRALGPSGYKYDDASGAVTSIERMLFKSGAQGRATILIRGQGSSVPLVLPPLTSPITIQLINGSSGICWGADFSVSQMRRNDAEQLKAKTP
jgi:hypothetical protein